MNATPIPFEFERKELQRDVFLVTLVGAPSSAQFDAFLEGMAQFFRGYASRNARVSLLLDPSGLTRFDASMRQAYGEWRARHMDLIGNSCQCAAYVTQSAMWRGIMTAVFWVAQPVVPVQTFASRKLALEWVVANQSR